MSITQTLWRGLSNLDREGDELSMAVILPGLILLLDAGLLLWRLFAPSPKDPSQ